MPSHRLQLPREPQAPRRARQALTERFASELGPGELEVAKLLTTELVTNAVRYGQGTITVCADLDERRLLVEVIDEGTGFTRPAANREPSQIGGCGLHIVESASSRWGIRDGSTHVWFELERRAPAPLVEGARA